MCRLSNLASKSFAHNLSIVVVVSLCLCKGATATQTESTANSLERDKPIERSINAGETHSYTLTLTSGQYAHIAVDQRGVDVVVSIFAPDGTKLVQVDMPNGLYGPERSRWSLKPQARIELKCCRHRRSCRVGTK
jgi:hypothetical protein